MCSHVVFVTCLYIKARLVSNFCYASSFKIMATSTYGVTNGGLVKSAKMKSVKAISSVVSEKQGYKQNHAYYVVVSSGCYVCFVYYDQYGIRFLAGHIVLINGT